jgi:hypothetical protein
MRWGLDASGAVRLSGALATSSGFLRFQSLLHPAIGERDVPSVPLHSVVHRGTLAHEKVHVSHGVVILWIDLQRLCQVRHAVLDEWPGAVPEVLPEIVVRDGARLIGLHAGLRENLRPLRIPFHPVDHAVAVPGFLVPRIDHEEFLDQERASSNHRRSSPKRIFMILGP